MKQIRLSILLAVALFSAAVVRVHAQADIPQASTITASILINSTNYSYNGNVYSQPLPAVMRMTTKDVINLLTNYYSTPVPSTAKLVRVYGDSFEVDDTSGNTLISDFDQVLYLDRSGMVVWTGTGADDNSIPGSETDYGVATLYIYTDATMDIALTGYATATLKTSVATASGVKVSQAFTMKTASGVSVIGNGDPSGNAIATGSFSSKGTGMY